jgi:hypothetical protein
VDVGSILQIPLNDQGFEDFLAWIFTKVRSGYYLQWKHQFGPSAGQLALPGQFIHNPVWKILWRLKIPSKIKNLYLESSSWHSTFKCILANRHIGDSGACPICNQGAEDVLHLLFTCPMAVEFMEVVRPGWYYQ